MQVRIMYQCTVCGYPKLKYPPEDHVICPSCGTQFGLDDEGPYSKAFLHRDLRDRWRKKGANWYSRVVPMPLGWNGYNQLINAGLLFDAEWLHGVVVTSSVTYREDSPTVYDDYGPNRLAVAS
jgi:hypothetical protein